MPLDERAIVRAPTITVVARPHFAAPPQLPMAQLGDATDSERLAEFAARLHRQSLANPAGRPTREFLAQLNADDWDRALQHVHWTLLIEGISQTLAHELALQDHGLIITDQGLRATEDSRLRFVLPPAFVGDAALEQAWSEQLAVVLDHHRQLVDGAMTRFRWMDDKVQRRTVAREAAAAALPLCVERVLLVTGSARHWQAWLRQALGERAGEELRRLGEEVGRTLEYHYPGMFRYAARAGLPTT